MVASVLNDYVLVTKKQNTDGGLYAFSSATNLLPADNDDNVSPQTAIGFTFNLAGVDYTHFHVSANGWLGLATSSGASVYTVTFKNYWFDDAARAEVLLSPWWDDLETAHDDGYVKYEYQAASERLVVEWNCHTYMNMDTTNNTKIKMQAVLSANGNIEFRFGEKTTNGTGGATTQHATVGVRTDTTSGVSGNIRDFGWIMKQAAGVGSPQGSDDATGGDNGSAVVNLALGDWPGENGGGGPYGGDPYNVYFLKDTRLHEGSIFAFGDEVSVDSIDKDFIIHDIGNTSTEYKYLIREKHIYKGISKADHSQAPFGKVVKGPVNLRGRTSPYVSTRSGKPDEKTN